MTSLESKLDEILAAFGVTMEEEGNDAVAGREDNKKNGVENGTPNDGK